MIYFDNAATSLIKPYQLKPELIDVLNNYTANPGRSGHNLAVKTAEKIFDVREKVKCFLGAENYNLIFTKNCTEALNLAIFGTLNSGDHVITTCYEHNAVLRPLEVLKSKGVEVTVLDCDVSEISEAINKNIKANTALVVTTFVSNVTGEKVDVETVAKVCKNYNVKYLIDAAQACGHIEIDMKKIGADMLAFAGHKGLLATTGVGGLLIKNLSLLKPILYGGTGTNSESLVQTNDDIESFEAGTLPSFPIFSLGIGVDCLSKNFQKILKKEENLSKYAYFSLKKLDFLEIYSKKESLNVFSFNIKNCSSAVVVNLLNEQFGICVRSGLHCAPLIHKKLKTLPSGAVRVSLDFNNTFEEIDKLVYALKRINAFLTLE